MAVCLVLGVVTLRQQNCENETNTRLRGCGHTEREVKSCGAVPDSTALHKGPPLTPLQVLCSH